ncbi:fumarate reductase subunit C [Kribbella sp. NBC_01245]|uniref:fumarate reductase subunit C n=1 Tax=Kribbella sp. NBC_01245 TaxID=2903578 RepID=UPI002E2D7125|nr:fumarate reductase subunit C [Kribbella sp. NBC_01245]
MTDTPHPYHRPVSTFWWLERRSYLVFVLRELSSVFVAWFVVYLLLLVSAISAGSGEYERFVDWSGRAWVLVLNVVALLFVLLHAVTWFGLAPKAIVVRMRGRRVPPRVIAAAHYLLWLVLSAVTAWVILR